MNVPISFALLKVFTHYKIVREVLDGKLNSILVSTLVNKGMTQEEVTAFVTNEDSPINTMMVMRQWRINGVSRYSIESYAKYVTGRLEVQAFEVSEYQYKRYVSIFNMGEDLEGTSKE